MSTFKLCNKDKVEYNFWSNIQIKLVKCDVCKLHLHKIAEFLCWLAWPHLRNFSRKLPNIRLKLWPIQILIQHLWWFYKYREKSYIHCMVNCSLHGRSLTSRLSWLLSLFVRFNVFANVCTLSTVCECHHMTVVKDCPFLSVVRTFCSVRPIPFVVGNLSFYYLSRFCFVRKICFLLCFHCELFVV